MLGRKKHPQTPAAKDFDREKYEPAIRCSICTGERTAGFRDVRTGKFNDVMLIGSDEDLKIFMETYGVDKVRKIY